MSEQCLVAEKADRPSLIATKAEPSHPLEKTNAGGKGGFNPGEQRKLQNHFCF